MQLFRKQMQFHPHVLVFLLQSAFSSYKFSLANFATKNARASQIFWLFVKAVASYHTQCAIRVDAATCDGESAIRKFFRMNFGLTHDDELNADTDTVYNFLVEISIISTSFLTHHNSNEACLFKLPPKGLSACAIQF